MRTYSLYRTQFLKTSIEEAWNFFSSPNNLSKITPEYLKFNILSGFETGHIEDEQLIKYTVSPLLGIPMKWVTKIEKVKQPFSFSDTQLKGPYKKWEHTHSFRSVPGGVEMTDSVSYEMPMGVLGELAHTIFVKNQIENIFNFRNKILEKLFNQKNDNN